MKDTANSELVMTSKKKPVLTFWDENRSQYKMLILEDEDEVVTAEILAFAGSITAKSGVAPLSEHNPLNFTYDKMAGRIFRSSAGITVVLRKGN